MGSDTLDEVGDLGITFRDLSIHSDSNEPDFDNPLEFLDSTTSEPPPRYEQVCPEAAIESALIETHRRCLMLTDAGFISLVTEDLEAVLSRHPGHQGKEYHSTLLYQSLRKLYSQGQQLAKILKNLDLEFKSLPFDFIASHDPQAITDYAKTLQALGRTEESLAFLSQRVTQTSRPYIRRQAALLTAQIHEQSGSAEEAENAYIEALVTAHQDPEAYLALIRHYYTQGNSRLAQALVGVMNRVILPSPQWKEYGSDLQRYIRDHLPASLSDYKYSEDDLMMAIKLWICKGRLEASAPYWLPLIADLSEGGDFYIFFGDDRKSLKKLLLDLVNDLSLTPDQRLQYYKVLYSHRKSWIHNGFYATAFVNSALNALTEEFKDPDQAFEMAQFVVDRERENGLFARRLAHIESLKVLVTGYLSRKNQEQALIAFIDLIRQYRWDNTSSTLQNLMGRLAPLMDVEHATRAKAPR